MTWDLVLLIYKGLNLHRGRTNLFFFFFFVGKVDLTAYVEKHEFCFDAVLDEQVTNDEVVALPYIQ